MCKCCRNFKIFKSFLAVISLCKGQLFLTWCLISLLTTDQIQLVSSYNGSSRTVKLGSSFDFSWNFTGDLRRVEWGTKDRDKIALDVLLFVLYENRPQGSNVSQYNGRCFGSWNQQSPNLIMFTLSPIKEVDNRLFIFRFVPISGLHSVVFDMVQLIVKGKNFYWWIVSSWRVVWSSRMSK